MKTTYRNAIYILTEGMPTFNLPFTRSTSCLCLWKGNDEAPYVSKIPSETATRWRRWWLRESKTGELQIECRLSPSMPSLVVRGWGYLSSITCNRTSTILRDGGGKGVRRVLLPRTEHPSSKHAKKNGFIWHRLAPMLSTRKRRLSSTISLSSMKESSSMSKYRRTFWRPDRYCELLDLTVILSHIQEYSSPTLVPSVAHGGWPWWYMSWKPGSSSFLLLIPKFSPDSSQPWRRPPCPKVSLEEVIGWLAGINQLSQRDSPHSTANCGIL